MTDDKRGGRPPRKQLGDKKPRADKKTFGGRKPFDDKRTLTEELVELDRDLAALVARRTRLLSRAASARHAKGLALADPSQERRMRRAWDDVAGMSGLDVAPLRQIFALANGLAYNAAVKPESARRKFVMNLAVKDADLALPGPRSRTRTRMVAALAALTGADCSLYPAIINDPLIELVRALNQAGAALSWEEGRVVSAGGALDAAGKTLHAGDDPLNLFLLLALCLPQVGRTTITGGTRLKLLDLGPAAGVLAGLGVRLTSIEPHVPGAPVRLESAGMTTGACRLPGDFPPGLALAMALAGPTYPEGLRMTWDAGWSGAQALGHAVDVLASCGVDAELSETEFFVPRAALAAPKGLDPEVAFLDPELAAVLLALPRFTGGSVTLAGLWPAGDPEADAAEALLRAAGLEIVVSGEGVRSSAGSWPDELDLDATRGFFPLAVALGLASPGDARIGVAEDEDTATAEDLAGRMGRFARVKPGRVVIVGGGNTWADPMRPFPCPSAQWSLALALASTTARGVTLANPGVLSETWPGFWGLFADNFKPKDKEPAHDDGAKKGRRIRIPRD
ncbi:hypothetical protein [Desulfocurvus sp. DL9XJH121]